MNGKTKKTRGQIRLPEKMIVISGWILAGEERMSTESEST